MSNETLEAITKAYNHLKDRLSNALGGMTLDQFVKRTKDLEADNVRLRGENAELVQVVDGLANVADEESQEVADYKATIEGLEKKLAVTEDELSDVRGERNRLWNVQKENKELREKNLDLRTKFQIYKKEELAGGLDSMHRKISSLEDLVGTLRTDNESLRGHCRKLQKELDEALVAARLVRDAFDETVRTMRARVDHWVKVLRAFGLIRFHKDREDSPELEVEKLESLTGIEYRPPEFEDVPLADFSQEVGKRLSEAVEKGVLVSEDYKSLVHTFEITPLDGVQVIDDPNVPGGAIAGPPPNWTAEHTRRARETVLRRMENEVDEITSRPPGYVYGPKKKPRNEAPPPPDPPPARTICEDRKTSTKPGPARPTREDVYEFLAGFIERQGKKPIRAVLETLGVKSVVDVPDDKRSEFLDYLRIYEEDDPNANRPEEIKEKPGARIYRYARENLDANGFDPTPDMDKFLRGICYAVGGYLERGTK